MGSSKLIELMDWNAARYIQKQGNRRNFNWVVFTSQIDWWWKINLLGSPQGKKLYMKPGQPYKTKAKKNIHDASVLGGIRRA